MRVSLKFDGVDTKTLRAVLAACSEERDNFHFVDWEPKVSCNGPELFGVEVSPTNVGSASRILRATHV